MIVIKNVMVATDFGAASETALAYGRDLARTFGATLHVFHAVEDVVTRTAGIEGYITDLSGLSRGIEASARKQLDAIVTDEDRRQLGARTMVRMSTSIAPAIVEYAKEARIDVIVIGTHGRGAVAHLLMGSVAEKVVRTAPCPVLTVRHPQHEFLAPDALQAVAQSR